MATSPARASKTRPAPAEPKSDLEVVSRDEDAGTFTARCFGSEEEFTFYTDVNFLLLLISYGGSGEDLGQLSTIIKSLIAVDDEDDGMATWRRFITVLAEQRKMDAERSMRFINDLVGAAGNEIPEPSDA